MASRPSGLRQPTAVKSSNTNLAAPSGGAASAAAEPSAATPAKTTGGSAIPMSRLPSSNSIRRKITTPAGIHAPGSRDSGLATDIDHFIIGDTVYVNGDPAKRGKICFIGEVDFAKGDFAGVALDLPMGNHDGVVQGKRYFQCSANHGLFTKLSRLARDPNSDTAATPRAPQSTASSVVMSPDPVRSRPASIVERTPSPSGQRTPVKAMPFANSSLNVGERVIVASATGGTKIGILRYLGTTEFAAGDWAGVELLTPMGKNNGSVGGKRYFTCKEKHGLFVPSSKVISSPVNKTPRRHGSRESLISVSSLASSAASRSIRRPSVRDSNCLPSCSLQAVLAEKEKHIEHLIKERELDRVDLANLSRQYEEKIMEVKKLQVDALTQQSSGGDIEAVARLQNLLEEEHRKLEDLQYTLDEERIMKADLQTQLDTLGPSGPVAATIVGVSEEQTKEVEALKSQLVNQQEEAKNLTLNLNEAQAKVQTLEKTVDELTQKGSSLSEDLSASKNDREKLAASHESNIAALTKTSTDQAALIEKLKQQLSDKKKREDDMKERIHKLEVEFENAHKQKCSLEAEVIDLVSAKTDTSDLLTSKITDLNGEILELREKLQSTDEDKAVLRRINAEFKTRIAKYEQSEKALKQELEEASAKSSEEKAEFEKQSSEQTSNLESTKQKLQEEAGAREKEISLLKTKVSETENKLHTASEKSQEQLSEIESLKSSITDLTIQLTDHKEQLQKAEEDKTSLKVDVEKKQKEVTELMNSKTDTSELLSGKISELNEEIQELKAKLQSVEEDKAVLRRINGEFKARVEKLEKLAEALKKDREDVSNRFAEEKSALEKELSDRVSIFESEKQKAIEEITTKTENIKALEAKLHAAETNAVSSADSLKKQTEEVETLKSKLGQAVEEIDEHKQTFQKLEQEKGTQESEAKKKQQELTQKCNELAKKFDNLNEELSSSINESTSLKGEAETFKLEINQLKQIGEEKAKKIVELVQEINSLQTASKEKNEQKDKELNQKSTELTAQIQQLSSQLTSSSDESSTLKKQIENLTIEITKSKQTDEEKSCKIKGLEGELEAAKKQAEEGTGTLDELQLQVDSLKKDKSNLKEKLIAYKGDSNRFQEIEQGLCQELAVLRNKLEQQNKLVSSMEKELAEKRADIESSKASMLDANSPQAHIDFLNSIIVDLQRKNEELNVKLNVLINGGGSGDADANTNKTTTTARTAYQSLRPYCDICEKFDLHDTEDCPAQVSEDNTHYGSVRGESRPYCETCEIFGHVTGECDDQETY